MKILVSIPFSFYHPSGSSLSSYHRIMALLELGHEVDVLTYPHGENIEHSNLTIFRSPEKKIFKYFQAGQYKKKLVYDFILFIKSIKLLSKNNYEVVIVHGTMTYLTALLIPFFRTNFIAMKHGNLDVEMQKWNISNRKFFITIARKIDVFFANRYKYIICEHSSVKNKFIESGLKEKKLFLIKISVPNASSENKKTTDSKSFNILYTGTFVSVQNIELLYQAGDLLMNENIMFYIIGGNDKELEYETTRIKNYTCKGKVKLLKRIGQEELIKYYNKADIVVSPRKFGHDTPMKIFDYMNFGKCILASNKLIHTEILNPQNSYLADPTPESFAKAIIHLINNPETVNKLAIQAKNDFEHRYSFNNMKIKYIELLEKVYHTGI